MMPTVQRGPVIGLIGQFALLSVLAGTVGLGAAGWLVGSAYGLATATVLSHALTRAGRQSLGAANRVTLSRATLVGGVTALLFDDAIGPRTVPVVVGLAAVALLLDGVDGQVARRTGTVSSFGARFDMEVDAFLILVLSIEVAQLVGPAVLGIGAARYAFWLAAWVVPWMRAPLPPRYWRKPVAAIQGIVLTAAVAFQPSGAVIDVAIAVAMILLAESFGRDVLWQWRRRRVALPDGLARVDRVSSSV
jgi:phosphatidylglycerophosphate synthase